MRVRNAGDVLREDQDAACRKLTAADGAENTGCCELDEASYDPDRVPTLRTA